MLEVEVREEDNYLSKREEEKSAPGLLELKRKYGEQFLQISFFANLSSLNYDVNRVYEYASENLFIEGVRIYNHFKNFENFLKKACQLIELAVLTCVLGFNIKKYNKKSDTCDSPTNKNHHNTQIPSSLKHELTNSCE